MISYNTLQSIMLYFYPKSLTTNNTGTSMNVRLSPYDTFYINSRYPGSSQTPIEFYRNVYGEDIINIIPKNNFVEFNFLIILYEF